MLKTGNIYKITNVHDGNTDQGKKRKDKQEETFDRLLIKNLIQIQKREKYIYVEERRRKISFLEGEGQ